MEWPLLIAAGLGAGVLADRIATVECRAGRPRRPLRSALVASGTAVLFVLFGLRIGTGPVLPGYLWFGAVTVTLGLVDACERRIPNRILLPGTAMAAALIVVGAILTAGPLIRPFAAGVSYFALLYLTGRLSRGGIGAGDVKLSFLLGMFAGYLTWAALVVAIVVAFLLGGIAAIVGLVIAHKKRADAIAFGPYLILGAYGGILAGVPVAAWYLSGWA